MGHFFKRVVNALSNRFWNFMDLVLDLRICGRSLGEYVPSVFRDDENGIGGTGSQSTHYIILKRIYSHVVFSPTDAFMDVGCGKGRILAFLIGQKCPCSIHGIELNEEVGKLAQEWTKRYPQVQVTVGDAFQIDYNPYTILSLARPFLPKTFLSFVELLESSLTHPITLVYWVDQQSGHLLLDRPGWKLQYREKLSRIFGIKIATSPQSYSIWSYDPAKNAETVKPGMNP